MILQQYIQEMLFRQGICSVPGVGTFTLQHQPAQYNTYSQSLTGPSQTVVFDPYGKDDGSFLEWISLKENLVPAVAQRKLDKYLEELQTRLQSGTLHIPGAGELAKDAHGYIFKPDQPPVAGDAVTIRPVERATAPVAPTPAPVPHVDAEPMMSEEAIEDVFESAEAAAFRWWWVVAPIVAGLAGIGIWWFVTRTPVNTAPLPPQNNTQAQVDTMLQTDTTAGSDIVPASSDTLQYYVVIDRYKDSTAAQRMYNRQKSWGRNVTIYKRDTSGYRLAIPVKSLPQDTGIWLDSLRKTFGAKAFLEF